MEIAPRVLQFLCLYEHHSLAEKKTGNESMCYISANQP